MSFECTYSLAAGSAPVSRPSLADRSRWTGYEVRSPYTGNKWLQVGRWVFNVAADATTSSVKGTLTLTPNAADPDDVEIQKAFAQSQTIRIRLKFGNGNPADLTVFLKP